MVFEFLCCILLWIFYFIFDRGSKVFIEDYFRNWNHICKKKKNLLKVSDKSKSLEMTSWIITFFIFILYFNFSIKVISEIALTLSVKKGLPVLQIALLSVTSIILILPKNICFAFLTRLTQ